MDVSFSIHQVTGAPINPEKVQHNLSGSVNQFRNVGGNIPGFVAEIVACRVGSPVILTTSTHTDLESLDKSLNAWLGFFHDLKGQ